MNGSDTAISGKHAMMTALLLLAAMVLLAACNATPKPTEQPDLSQTDPPASLIDQIPENSGMLEPGALGSGTDGEENAALGEEETGEPIVPEQNESEPSENPAPAIEAEGVYNGQIDSNFIEISSADSVAVYLITEEVADRIASLSSNDTIRFTYREEIVDSDNGLKHRILLSVDRS